MRFPKQLFAYMPFLLGAGCATGSCADTATFPASPATCECDTAVGGINELYFIPCTTTFTAAYMTTVANWSTLITGGKLGRSGLGVGSIAKKGDTRKRVASCRAEQVTGITWGLTFKIYCMDKTSARTTQGKLNQLLTNASAYLVVARMCDGEETILPIGRFTTSDLNWTVPETSDDNQEFSIELSWKELGIPTTIDVAGLAAVLPKLS